MFWVYFWLIFPGVAVAYFLFVRPALHSVPAWKDFWLRADGFWQSAWALCGNSLWIAFGYFIQVLSWLLQWMDPIATFLGDPDMRTQLTETLKADPKILGYVLMAISFCTIAARLRSMKPSDE